MPIDSGRSKATTAATTTNKPLTPTLSSHLRARPALTPRLVGSNPSSAASPVTVPYRSLRAQTLSPERGEDEKPFGLGSNVTPRSGARLSRIDTESPTTPDTVARARTKSRQETEAGQIDEQYGLGIQSPTPSVANVARPRSVDVLAAPFNMQRAPKGANEAQAKEPTRDESKFFRADDIKMPFNISRAPVVKPKEIPSPWSTGPELSPGRTADTSTKIEEKFFHADDAQIRSQNRPLRPPLAFKSATYSVTSAPPSAARAFNQSTHHMKSSSVLGTASSISSSHVASFPTSRVRSSSNQTSSTTKPATERRRSSSLDIRPPPPNNDYSEKGSSIGSETNQVLQDDVSCSDVPLSTSPSVIQTLPGVVSNHIEHLPTSATTVQSEFPPTPRPVFHRAHTRGFSTDTTPSQSQVDAAHSARRERKVLDLEISNSSLLAINRTLEKELRKQNSELRRFRRLSRSGRISLTPSHRVLSGQSLSMLDTLDENDDGDSNCLLSSHASDISDSDVNEDDENFSEDGSSTMGSSDVARRRARDEAKLLQDLRQHQQLLLNSQKLAQSIQRCLNTTDDMIKEGHKALAYQVGIGDLKLGGRVLAPDEEDEAMSEVDASEFPRSEPRQALLSPSVDTEVLKQETYFRDGAKQIDTAESLSPILGPQWTDLQRSKQINR